MGERHDGSFEELVLNAFDFVERSLRLIEEDPKLSVIFFWTALELFVKARLLKEHWSLVLADPRRADLKNFGAGDFQSITFDTAMERIEKVLGKPVKGATNPCFEALRKHRNKLVHFFNADFSGSNKKAVQVAAIEECRAWFYLHRWLSSEWSTEFSDYDDRIEQTHGLVSKNRKYFAAKYQELKSDIEKLGRLNEIVKCLSCGYEASIQPPAYQQSDLSVVRQQCLVCHYHRRVLTIQCEECGSTIEIEDLGEGACDKCSTTVDMKYLKERYGKRGSPEDELLNPSDGYCSDCEYPEACVVRLENDQYLCLSCLNISDELNDCEYCGTRITGDAENTYLSGCVLCEGRGFND